jgi:hypothetical protein
MTLAKSIDLKRIAALTQWEKIVIIMVLTCAMPFLFHLVPGIGGPGMGMRWLPMYYAPIIASICFRPHVSIMPGILSPVINHALFGMPSEAVLPGMVFELASLSMVLALMHRRMKVRGWHVVPLFAGIRFLSLFFWAGAGSACSVKLLASLAASWPGVVVLAVLVEIAGHAARREA